MFGRHSRRVARRQRVLEELLWLDPIDRERRVIAAVAAGDFTAAELDAALRLVNRLDSLRVFSLPPGGRLLGGQPYGFPEQESDEEPDSHYDPGLAADRGSHLAQPLIDSGGPDSVSATPVVAQSGSLEPPAAFHGESATEELTGIPIVSERVAVPVEQVVVGIPVVPDAEAAGGVLGYGSVESTEAGVSSPSPEPAEPTALPIDALESTERLIARTGSNGGARVKARSEDRRVAEASPEWQGQGSGDQAQAVTPADEAWPSINWLRPN